MKKLWLPWLFLLVGCSSALEIQIVRYPWVTFERRAGECHPKVFFSDEPQLACRAIGDVFVGDNGYSHDCEQERVLDEVKKQTCAYGADAARIVRVDHPGTKGSNCYQVRAAFLRCDDALLKDTAQ
jgi:hypothetical protein